MKKVSGYVSVRALYDFIKENKIVLKSKLYNKNREDYI